VGDIADVGDLVGDPDQFLPGGQPGAPDICRTFRTFL
jgi:hypothetical protein